MPLHHIKLQLQQFTHSIFESSSCLSEAPGFETILHLTLGVCVELLKSKGGSRCKFGRVEHKQNASIIPPMASDLFEKYALISPF